MNKLRICCYLIAACFMSCLPLFPPPPVDTDFEFPEDSDSLHYDIVNDMFLSSEGMPAGVPNYYDWKHKPRVNLGLKIPSGWNAVYAWGQVYADEKQPNPDKKFPLARVHIKDLQLYIYRSDGTWDLIQEVESPIGDHYVEDFEGNVNKPAEIRKEAGGGISIQAGSGFNFHFYPKSQKQLDNFDIKGVLVICKARLIGIETYSTLPRYLLNVGGDYWRNTSVGWEPNYKNNDDIAIGRFKYVTPEWRHFTMHTFKPLSAAEKIIFPVE